MPEGVSEDDVPTLAALAPEERKTAIGETSALVKNKFSNKAGAVKGGGQGDSQKGKGKGEERVLRVWRSRSHWARLPCEESAHSGWRTTHPPGRQRKRERRGRERMDE